MIDPKRKAYLDAAAAMIDGDISSIDAETLQLALEAASEESDNTLAAVVQLELSAREDLKLSDRFNASMRLELDRRDIKGYTRKLKNGTVVHVKPHARVFKEMDGNLDAVNDSGLERRANDANNPDVIKLAPEDETSSSSTKSDSAAKQRSSNTGYPDVDELVSLHGLEVDKGTGKGPTTIEGIPVGIIAGYLRKDRTQLLKELERANKLAGQSKDDKMSGPVFQEKARTLERVATWTEGVELESLASHRVVAKLSPGDKVTTGDGTATVVENDARDRLVEIKYDDGEAIWLNHDELAKSLVPDELAKERSKRSGKRADLSDTQDFESSMLSSDNKNTRGGVTVGTATNERATGVDASKLALDLSDAQATIAEQQKQLDSMRSREHARDVEDAAVALQKRGLPSAFCVEARELMLADDGGPVLELNLSDEEGGKQTVTVRGIVERLSNTLFDEEGKSLLRKQASDELNLSDEERPKNAPDSKTTTERADEIAAELGMEKK